MDSRLGGAVVAGKACLGLPLPLRWGSCPELGGGPKGGGSEEGLTRVSGELSVLSF